MRKILLAVLICVVVFSGCESKEKNSGLVESTLINQEKSENDSDNKEKSENDSDNIVLYNGYLLKKDFKRQNSSNYDEEYDGETLNRDYRNYENGKYIGITNGKVAKGETFGENCVANVKKVAITGDYNAIPRVIQKLNKIPDNLINKINIEENEEVSSLVVDLDGNGTNEMIVCTIDRSEYHIKSDVVLYDASGTKIGRIIYIDEQEAFGEMDLLDGVEIIDIDNDGIMEIIADIPCYELHGCYEVTVLKYDGEKLIGEYDIGYMGA